MTRPEPVPIKEAQNCIVKSPVPSPTEEENQIISIEEEILNQGMKNAQLYQYNLF